jgi:putative N6-adenine-specific DNA methylase
MTDQTLTENSLKRRIKKYLPRENMQLFIPCPLNLAKVATEELISKGIANEIKATDDGLELIGDWKTIYQCNLHSSIGTRVLLRVGEFYVGSYPELFQKLKRIHWEVYFGFQKHFDVKISAKESRLHHTDNMKETFSEAVTLKMKDFDRAVTYKEGAVPCFYLRFYQDRCTVSLDTTGDNLYKRGYKQYAGEAPIRENLAAGMIKLVSKNNLLFVDPLCGGGTFGFEFLLDRLQIPTGSYRHFSFEQFPYFQQVSWEKLKLLNVKHNEKVKVYLNDRSAECMAGVLKTATHLGLEQYFVTKTEDMTKFLKELRFSEPYLMITNIPYGKRIALDKEDLLKDFLAFCRNRKQDGPYGFVAMKSQIVKNKVGLNQQILIKNGGLNTIFCFKE